MNVELKEQRHVSFLTVLGVRERACSDEVTNIKIYIIHIQIK